MVPDVRVVRVGSDIAVVVVIATILRNVHLKSVAGVSRTKPTTANNHTIDYMDYNNY